MICTGTMNVKQIHLHSVSSFRQYLDHKFLIILPPSPHARFRVRVDNGPNIIRNVLFLSALIVEGHLARGQRPQGISYIEFWATCDTNTKVWNLKVNEFLQQPKYPIAR